MTHHTEAERAEFEDGAWYWVEEAGWIGDPPTIAPAMYKANCGAWYSWEFSDIPTRYLKVLEPCRRAPAAPVPQQVEAAIDALVFAAVIEGGVSNDRAKDARAATHQRKAELLSMLAVAPQPPEVGCSVSNGETEEEPRAFETHVAAPVPQARKPLTDEECDRLISALCPDFTDERFPTDRPVMRQLARDAIAHGIGATHGQ